MTNNDKQSFNAIMDLSELSVTSSENYVKLYYELNFVDED